MAHSAVHIWKTRKTSILGIALICVTLASLDAESRAKTESRYSGYLAKLSQPKTAKSSKEIAESPEEVAANKIPGIRAALTHDTYSAERAAKSNNAQIITMGARVIGPELAKAIVDTWLASAFDPNGSSAANVEAINKLDQ